MTSFLFVVTLLNAVACIANVYVAMRNHYRANDLHHWALLLREQRRTLRDAARGDATVEVPLPQMEAMARGENLEQHAAKTARRRFWRSNERNGS